MVNRSATSASGAITDSLGRIVRQATLPRFSDRVAQRAGTALDRSAFALLARLDDEPRRIGELATITGLDMSTVSRQVDALEHAGLAHRKPHPTDKRGWLAVIADPGRRALHAHRQARREIFHQLLADVDADELAITAAVLDQLAERIEALAADQP